MILTVSNIVSLLNWRNWFSGSSLVDTCIVNENLIPMISTTLQGTTQSVWLRRFRILLHVLTITYVYSYLLQFLTDTSFLYEVGTRDVIAIWASALKWARVMCFQICVSLQMLMYIWVVRPIENEDHIERSEDVSWSLPSWGHSFLRWLKWWNYIL